MPSTNTLTDIRNPIIGNRTPDNPELLPIAAILRQVEIDRSALNRYLALPENREALGGGGTHPNYPATSLPLFHALAKQHAQKTITPATMAAAWRARPPELTIVEGGDRYSETDNRNPDNLPQIAISASSMAGAAEVLADALIRAGRAAGLVIGTDRLLGAEEAAKLLHCSEATLRRRVRPVLRGTWRMSDLQSYIASLGKGIG